MFTLTEIWNRRRQNNTKTWNGDDMKCGFDFPENPSVSIQPNLRYGSNWKDRTIHDLRDILTNLSDGILSAYLPNEQFEIQIIQSSAHTLVCLQSKITTLTIIASCIENQSQFTIYTDIGVFSVSWYKSRGHIDSIINAEYGTPITIQELTDILVLLGLESEYELI